MRSPCDYTVNKNKQLTNITSASQHNKHNASSRQINTQGLYAELMITAHSVTRTYVSSSQRKRQHTSSCSSGYHTNGCDITICHCQRHHARLVLSCNNWRTMSPTPTKSTATTFRPTFPLTQRPTAGDAS